ncbi:MAG TPA: hypothetical protein VK783_13085 [Bacteroidia bacterium]|nr:hypothetical protein [Bacteroidia bacterium]
MKTNTFYQILTGTILTITIVTNTQAQNVGVNSTGTAPNAAAIMDLNTGNTFTSPNGKGLMVPNVAITSTTDAVTIASPPTSLLIYNTANAGTYPTSVSPGYYYNSGTSASPLWTRLQTVTGAVSFPYENRFYPAGNNCSAAYYIMNSSNYGPGTYGDNNNPYSNYSDTYYTTTPASIPAFYGVWYVSWTATATTQFVGYTGWAMVENQYNGAVNSTVLPSAPTIGLYFYKYTPTSGNTGTLAGTLIASGTISISKSFVPEAMVFSPASPVTLNKGDIIIGYATSSNCPYVGTTYSIIDLMGTIQFQ